MFLVMVTVNRKRIHTMSSFDVTQEAASSMLGDCCSLALHVEFVIVALKSEGPLHFVDPVGKDILLVLHQNVMMFLF